MTNFCLILFIFEIKKSSMLRFVFLFLLISNFSHSQKKMKIPPYLKKGDTVALFCTARKFFTEDAIPAKELL